MASGSDHDPSTDGVPYLLEQAIQFLAVPRYGLVSVDSLLGSSLVRCVTKATVTLLLHVLDSLKFAIDLASETDGLPSVSLPQN